MLIAARNAFMTRRLPYDAELEYLESTGTQWVDTGVAGRFDTVVELDNELTMAQASRGVFGSFSSSGVHRSLFSYVALNGRQQVGASGNLATPYLPSDTDRHLWQWVGNVVYKDGVEVFRNTYTYETTPQTLLLGNLHNATGGVYEPAYQKIYRCRIGDVRDYIPVRRGTVGYLYDRVTRRLFGNQGTGDFVLGPDVVPVEYIESHGTEWIDTGVVGDSNTTCEAMLWRNTQAVNECAIGSWNGGNTRCWIAYYFVNAFYLGMGARNSTAGTPQPNVWHRQTLKAESSNFNLYIDDVLTVSVPQSTFTSNQPLYIGAMNSSGTASYYFNGRFGAVKIYQNDILVRSFLPVRVGTGSTWAGAMMDVLTRRVYRNAGTGAFTYGNDLRYPIPAE